MNLRQLRRHAALEEARREWLSNLAIVWFFAFIVLANLVLLAECVAIALGVLQ